MLHYQSIQEAEEVLKALSAPTRVRIMELISGEGSLSMNDLAEALDLSNSAISMHVDKLESAGLVRIVAATGKRGNVKIVKPVDDRLIIELAMRNETRKFYQEDIRIGYYTNYSVTPTCGIATPTKIVGEFDDPRYFSFPDRFDAGILWFGSGFIEYSIPNRLQAGDVLTELQFSFELSSEYPDTNEDYPSDIHFSLNGIELGYWISPGDFGSRRGFVSPQWWPAVLNQYGLLKTLIINGDGTYIDGSKRISDVTIDDLKLDYTSNIAFRFSVPRDTKNCGGCTLFGESFGDYNQAIRVKAFF